MCILDIFKIREKKTTAPAKRGKEQVLGGSGSGMIRKAVREPMEEENPDEEYQLPLLVKGDFQMNEELQRRMQNEQLRKKYGIAIVKEGSYV